MMRRISAASLGGLALFIVLSCSSKKDDNNKAATDGGIGCILCDAGTGGSSGSQLEPCPIAQIDPGCSAASTSATLNTVNMLILLDKSGSMGKPGLGSTTSKWDAMKTALDTALNRAKLTINFGLDLFPSADVAPTCTGEACCQTAAADVPLTVAVGPGSDTVPTILTTLGATAPAGGTPMAAALTRALNYYTAGDGANLAGDKYVLLVTDGGPNCDTAAVPTCDATSCTRNLDPDPNCNQATNCCSTAALAVNCLDDASVTAQIQALAAANVKTIVVGIPGSDPYVQYLDQFAQSGGLPQPGGSTAYYSVAESAGASGLAETLHDITITLVKSCVIQYTTPPQDPTQVTVMVDCAPISREATEDGGDGTSWTIDTAQKTITIAGPTCDKILNEGVNRVDYVFGCVIPIF